SETARPTSDHVSNVRIPDIRLTLAGCAVSAGDAGAQGSQRMSVSDGPAKAARVARMERSAIPDRRAATARDFASLHPGNIRHDWTREAVRALFTLPFPDLIFRAQSVHRQHF